MSEFLNDNWMESGKDLELFKESIKKVQNATEIRKVPASALNFLSVFEKDCETIAIPLHGDNSHIDDSPLSLEFYRYDVPTAAYMSKKYSATAIEEAMKNGLFVAINGDESEPEVDREIIEKWMADGSFLPISAKAMNSFSVRSGIGGPGFLSEHLVRDLAIAKRMNNDAMTVNLVLRKDLDNGNQKVFAAMSNKYVRIPQAYIPILIKKIEEKFGKDLGKIECHYWSVEHSFTRCYIEFPEKGKEIMEAYEDEKRPMENLIPGLMFETSDIGDCSMRVRGYFRFEGSESYFFLAEEYSQIHTTAVNDETIMESLESKIFPAYTYYPTMLAQLMTINLTDDTFDEESAVKKMGNVYKKISKTISLKKAIGKKREKKYITEFCEAVNPLLEYTAYDVVIDFMLLASMIAEEEKGITQSLKSTIAKCIPDAVAFDFSEFAIRSEPKAA